MAKHVCVGMVKFVGCGVWYACDGSVIVPYLSQSLDQGHQVVRRFLHHGVLAPGKQGALVGRHKRVMTMRVYMH